MQFALRVLVLTYLSARANFMAQLEAKEFRESLLTKQYITGEVSGSKLALLFGGTTQDLCTHFYISSPNLDKKSLGIKFIDSICT